MGMHKGVWGWPATVVVVVAALGVVVLTPLVGPGSDNPVQTFAAVDFAVHLSVLVAAVLLYVSWGLSGRALAGWLAVVLILLTAPRLALSAADIINPVAGGHVGTWPLTVRLATAVVLLCLVLVTSAPTSLTVGPFAVRPLLVGGGGSLVLGATGFALLQWVSPWLSAPTGVAALSLCSAALAGVIVFVSARRASQAWPTGTTLTLGAVLVHLGPNSWQLVLSSPGSREAAAVTTIAGAVLLCRSATATLRSTLRRQRREMATLHRRLAAAQEEVRGDRARLHEVASTVAGITSVARLIREPAAVIPHQRRSLLEHTMEAELGRLERLMMSQSDGHRVFRIDEVIGQLVVAQHAQGHRVEFSPGGLPAFGQPDDVAEAVHVLLDNAAKHGRNAGAAVEVRQREGHLEILVSDRGPGIDEDVRGHVFDWGRRSASSQGQGIGLHVARRLLEQQGGYLILDDDSPHVGTTFIVGLMLGESRDTVGNLAG
jgi:signal transduction histidine kinase